MKILGFWISEVIWKLKFAGLLALSGGLLLAYSPSWAQKEDVPANIRTRVRGGSVFAEARPEWAFQVNASLRSLGGTDLSTFQNLTSTSSVGILFQYQPEFLQSLGVLSIGPSVDIYPSGEDPGVTRTPNTWAIGGEIRYQARFFDEQPIVPTAAFNYQYLAYQLATSASGRLTMTSPSFGAMILLNPFDPSTATDFYLNHGVVRSYLLAELRTYSGADAQVTFSGQSVFFGLRIEF